jgi:hypothetical protein
VLQVAVQRAPDPGVICCYNIRSNPPGRKNVVLDDVRSGTLLAFRERGQNRILSRTPEAVAELQIIPVLGLPDADLSEVSLVL